MTYESGTVETALLLLRELLKYPVVNKENNSGLIMRIQQDPEVLVLWQEVLEPTFGITLLKAGDEYYLTTGIEESIFSYTNAELRAGLGVSNNTELYTCSFIVLTLLAVFFDSDDTTGPSREFITLTDLERQVTQNFEILAKRDDLEELENRSRVNLAEPARFWLDLPVKKPGAVRDKNTLSRWGYLLKTLDFLSEHQLVRMIQDRQVFPEHRLSSQVAHYYNHRDHKNMILELIMGEGGEGDAAD
jgi:hypothetical protein